MAKDILFGKKQESAGKSQQACKYSEDPWAPREEMLCWTRNLGPRSLPMTGYHSDEIELEDPFENMGAQLVKEVATKTNDVAGDGTTTATLLAQAIIREGLKNVAAGANPMILKKGIQKAVDAAVEGIQKISQKVKGKNDIARVASISANDDDIGELIAEAMEKVSNDGVITVEESKTMSTNLKSWKGCSLTADMFQPTW